MMAKVRVDPDTNLPVLVKRSTEARVYYMDFASLLVGSTLASVTSLVSTKQDKVGGSTNITVGANSIDGSMVKATLSDGTDGENYKLIATVVDSLGNTLVGEGMLYVRDI